jgi:hypothetical protein
MTLRSPKPLVATQPHPAASFAKALLLDSGRKFKGSDVSESSFACLFLQHLYSYGPGCITLMNQLNSGS